MVLRDARHLLCRPPPLSQNKKWVSTRSCVDTLVSICADGRTCQGDRGINTSAHTGFYAAKAPWQVRPAVLFKSAAQAAPNSPVRPVPASRD